MIEAVQTEIPEAKANAIAQWLNRGEANDFVSALKMEMAALVSKATNAALERPNLLIATPQNMPPPSWEMLRDAARLQVCLEVLEEKKSGQSPLVAVQLKVE